MDIRDYADNEVIWIDGPESTGAVVTTTGDRDRFRVEVSIRHGITKKIEMSYDDVAQLVVDSICNNKELKKNLLFRNGFKEAVEHCRKIYKERGGEDIKYDNLDTEEENKLIAKTLPHEV